MARLADKFRGARNTAGRDSRSSVEQANSPFTVALDCYYLSGIGYCRGKSAYGNLTGRGDIQTELPLYFSCITLARWTKMSSISRLRITRYSVSGLIPKLATQIFILLRLPEQKRNHPTRVRLRRLL
jgi:hypothetical protein